MPVVVGMLRAYVRAAIATDDALIEMVEAWLLKNATGVRLDTLGALVGEPRKGRLDDAYRAAVRVRIRINASQSTTADLFDVWAALWSSAWTFREAPYGHFEITIHDAPQTLVPGLREALAKLRPLGHQASLVHSPGPESLTMRFAGEGASGRMPLQQGQAGDEITMTHDERL